jgi:ribosome maturation factor RimP
MLQTTAIERRIGKESALEARVAGIVEPVANDLGYDLVRVRVIQGGGLTLQIMAERPDGRFAVEDCEKLSKEISPALDVEDPIDREYQLEVSSPGIDRPLVRPRDFARWQGHEAKIELRDNLEGRRRFRGLIETSDGTGVTIHLPDVPEGAPSDHRLDFADIAEAKLVMTDELLETARLEQAADPTLDDPEIEHIEDPAGRD